MPDPKPHTTQGAGSLPQPDAAARAHSEQLTACIRDAMDAAGGAITFAQFMHMALYEPGLGYYSAGLRKFGREGDYVTAPEISPLFSRCIARQCAQVIAAGAGDILEFGAGSGVMAADLLAELQARDCLPDTYYILEVSAELRQRQHHTLSHACPHLLERVQWLDSLPGAGFSGIILANEVVDAMPVHRIYIDEHGEPGEYYVAWENDEFSWQRGTLSSDRLRERVDDINAELDSPLAPGYTTEINLAAGAWLQSLNDILQRGLILIIDYGFPRREYYHPQRSSGTLMCHYRHHNHDAPLILAGLQDITAHVDFTALAESAYHAGLDISGYTNQANFLLSSGLPDMANAVNADDPRSQMEAAQQIKKLTLPQEMGELFKVIALGRDLDMPLFGFTLRDDRDRL